MSMADELKKLHDLLQSGALTSAEFERAKTRLLDGEPAHVSSRLNRLRRSKNDIWIAGVCGGIAQATQVETWIWRLLFVLGAFAGGATIVLYIILWIFMPREGE